MLDWTAPREQAAAQVVCYAADTRQEHPDVTARPHVVYTVSCAGYRFFCLACHVPVDASGAPNRECERDERSTCNSSTCRFLAWFRGGQFDGRWGMNPVAVGWLQELARDQGTEVLPMPPDDEIVKVGDRAGLSNSDEVPLGTQLDAGAAIVNATDLEVSLVGHHHQHALASLGRGDGDIALRGAVPADDGTQVSPCWRP